jgi:hypothetical protein
MLLAVPVVFWLRVGISVATIALKLGLPLLPFGAAKKVFAVCDIRFKVKVPEVVTGLPLTVYSTPGDDSPTLVTVPEVAGAEDTHAVPFEVSTLPDAPDAASPVPPLATGTMPVSDILGVEPPLEAKGLEAVTAVTSELPKLLICP